MTLAVAEDGRHDTRANRGLGSMHAHPQMELLLAVDVEEAKRALQLQQLAMQEGHQRLQGITRFPLVRQTQAPDLMSRRGWPQPMCCLGWQPSNPAATRLLLRRFPATTRQCSRQQLVHHLHRFHALNKALQRRRGAATRGERCNGAGVNAWGMRGARARGAHLQVGAAAALVCQQEPATLSFSCWNSESAQGTREEAPPSSEAEAEAEEAAMSTRASWMWCAGNSEVQRWEWRRRMNQGRPASGAACTPHRHAPQPCCPGFHPPAHLFTVPRW